MSFAAHNMCTKITFIGMNSGGVCLWRCQTNQDCTDPTYNKCVEATYCAVDVSFDLSSIEQVKFSPSDTSVVISNSNSCEVE